MDSSLTWPDDARARVDDFLDRVERALMSRSISRAERASIVGEIETQIETLVARRSDEGAAVTQDLVAAVLDTMDPPTSYADPVEHDPVARPQVAQPRRARLPRTDPVAIAAISLLVYAGVAALLGVGMASHGDPLLIRTVVPAALFACGLGVWSMFRILRSDGWLHGLPFAYAATCGLPVIVIQILLFALANTPAGLILMMAMLFALDVTAHYWVIQRFWRRLAASYRPRPISPQAAAPSDEGTRIPAGI